MDEGGGERHLPGGPKSREEERTSNRVSQIRTEGGGYGAAHIDTHNMNFDRLVSNTHHYMPAMRFVVVVAKEFRKALLGLGESRPKKQGPARGESGAE
jgi:hypothetical protein